MDAEIKLYCDYRQTPVLARVTKNAAGEVVAFKDPLSWWKEKELRFPHLAELARRFLGIPATSAPVERLFSTAGLTIAKDRARLLPEHVAAMVFLHDTGPVTENYLAEFANNG